MRQKEVFCEVRMFVLDRIKMLHVTSECSAKGFQPGWARWVGEKIWHES